MEILDFGLLLLWAAAVLTSLIGLFSLLGIALRDRRFVIASRSGFYALFVVILGAALCLVYGFTYGTYNNTYIFEHSENALPFGFKIAGLWAGLEGSLIFWTFVLSLMCAITAFQHRWSSRHPAGRRMEPYTYLVLTAILGFFLMLSIQENAFDSISIQHAVGFANNYGIDLDSRGQLMDGKGLNPQLCNYWFVIHPPTLYLGMIIFTIPFAFAIAALISGELGDYWVRIARRWAMVAWLFLTSGVILGGLWAYRQLGWGGYWAWDPVENASFIPWCTATAFLHSIMIQERRDMLKWWNAFLIIFTFYLTIEATYMTRSGEVSSIHSFGLNPSLGDSFRYFKFAIAGSGFFLLFYRFRDLRGTHRLESLLSREAAFFINNLVLVAMCIAVWYLSWLPVNSHDYLGKSETIDPPYYNKVMTPLFMLLLFLTAIGPGLGWVKSSARSLRKNFFAPVLVSLSLVGLVYLYLWQAGIATSWEEVLVPKALSALGDDTDDLFYAVGIYPTGILLFLCFLIIATVVAEFWRSVGGRMRTRGHDLVTAMVSVFTRDNRRYGGYVVHVGLALMAIGITCSSLFRTYESLNLDIGESTRVDDYYITVVESNRDARTYRQDLMRMQSGESLKSIQPGLAYFLDEVTVRVSQAEPRLLPLAEAAAESPEELRSRAAAAPEVCLLKPELRFYPKQESWIPEVSIRRQILGDIYLTYQHREGNSVQIEVYLNPLMMLLWIGWFVMIAGALYALLPLGRKSVGLSE